MINVGLTGGIGAGKSTVARLLVAKGALLIDADGLARDVVATGTPGLAAVVARFGASVLQSDKGLDRQALARLVFNDPTALADLNAIIHPLVAEARATLLAAAAPDAVVVNDIPLLVENGLAGEFAAVIVVEAPPAVREERLVARGVAREDARARMAAQASDQARRAVATYVVDNSGSEAELRPQVDAIWAALTEL